MKASNILLFIIGFLLLLLQYGAYSGRNFEAPSLYEIDFSEPFATTKTMLALNAGTLFGFNFFGIFGCILLIILFRRINKNEKV
jgi:hypothetical protein